jgi:predicted transposase YdaD
MLGLSELKQTRVYRDALEEGRQEGRQEGREDGEKMLVLRLLQRRLGSIPADLEAQVLGLSLFQVEALGEALLDFSALTDLSAWLRGKG